MPHSCDASIQEKISISSVLAFATCIAILTRADYRHLVSLLVRDERLSRNKIAKLNERK